MRCFDDQQVATPKRREAPLQIGCERCNWWADRRRTTRRKLICRLCSTPITIRRKKAVLPTV